MDGEEKQKTKSKFKEIDELVKESFRIQKLQQLEIDKEFGVRKLPADWGEKMSNGYGWKVVEKSLEIDYGQKSFEAEEFGYDMGYISYQGKNFTRKFIVDAFATFLIKTYWIVSYGGLIYFFDHENNNYVHDMLELKKVIDRHWGNLTINNMKEVLGKIEIRANKMDVNINEYLVENGYAKNI